MCILFCLVFWFFFGFVLAGVCDLCWVFVICGFLVFIVLCYDLGCAFFVVFVLCCALFGVWVVA